MAKVVSLYLIKYFCNTREKWALKGDPLCLQSCAEDEEEEEEEGKEKTFEVRCHSEGRPLDKT